MLTTILATIVVLGVLIFVHELGHFVTAKLVDIEVPRFSIGLGPKLWGFRRGETEYVISWLPLGGYVKMAGMEEMEPIEGGRARPEHATGVAGATDVGLVRETDGRDGPRPRDFESKSLPARALVISAGVVMNGLFAALVFAATALAWGVAAVPDTRIGGITEERLPAGAESLLSVPPGARVVSVGDERVDDWREFERRLLSAPAGPAELRFADAPPVVVQLPAADSARAALVAAIEPVVAIPPVIGTVAEASPAAAAGLRAGDLVQEVAGRRVTTWLEFVGAVEARPGDSIPATVLRDGRTVRVVLVPEPKRIELGDGVVVGRIGVGSGGRVPRERLGLAEAAVHGVRRTGEVAVMIIELLGDLVTGDVSPRGLGGPIMIGQLSGQFARAGFEAFVNWMALLSVNLAVLNLLPIPVLDGGHLLFLAVEGVRGRALSFEQRMRLTRVGFAIVLATLIWVMASDVLRLFGL